MKTLIIYDSTGRIYYMASGDVVEPQGLPFLWTEVPEGKYISGVDVTGEEATVIFEDVPQSDTEQMQAQIDQLNETVANYGEVLDYLIMQ